MTPLALTFLVLSILLVWGGLAASVVALVRSSNGSPPEAEPGANGEATPDPAHP